VTEKAKRREEDEETDLEDFQCFAHLPRLLWLELLWLASSAFFRGDWGSNALVLTFFMVSRIASSIFHLLLMSDKVVTSALVSVKQTLSPFLFFFAQLNLLSFPGGSSSTPIYRTNTTDQSPTRQGLQTMDATHQYVRTLCASIDSQLTRFCFSFCP
jgi:hypothetical protein